MSFDRKTKEQFNHMRKSIMHGAPIWLILIKRNDKFALITLYNLTADKPMNGKLNVSNVYRYVRMKNNIV